MDLSAVAVDLVRSGVRVQGDSSSAFRIAARPDLASGVVALAKSPRVAVIADGAHAAARRLRSASAAPGGWELARDCVLSVALLADIACAALLWRLDLATRRLADLDRRDALSSGVVRHFALE